MHKQIDDEGTDKTTLIQTDSQSVKQTDRQEFIGTCHKVGVQQDFQATQTRIEIFK